MTGVCPNCHESYSVPSRRGSKVCNHSCPNCKVPLRGRSAGKKRAKYCDLLHGGLFVFADDDTSVHYVRLTEPMVLAPWEPYETSYTRHDKPGSYDQRIIDRAAGQVFGPGCVVERRSVEGTERYGLRWPYLTPAPDGFDAATLVESNGPIKQVKCRGCGDLLTEPAPRPGVEWKPVRNLYRPHRSNRMAPTKPGPHPADAPGCVRCYPATWPQDVQEQAREDVW